MSKWGDFDAMKIVLVGCTHAGVAAAMQILKEHPESDVVIYEREDNVSFLSCGIALYLAGTVKRLEDMFYATPASLRKAGATVHIQHDVLKIDVHAKQLTIQNLLTNEVFKDTYDKLLVTTGSYVVVPPVYGVSEERVLMCKNYQQAQAIYATASQHAHIAIVGGGYIGVELAESYTNTGHQVTLLQGNDQLLNHYIDPAMSKRVVRLLEAHGTKVLLNERVQAFHSGASTADPITIETAMNTYQVDLAIVCTGFMANTELLRGQIEMDRHGAIMTNDYLQTSDPDVYAAGDACTVKFNPTGEQVYIPLATNAVRQGMIAGRNLFGNLQRYPGTQGTTAMPLFNHHLASTGLTLKNALEKGINAAAVTYEDTYRPKFMPTADRVMIRLVYARDTRRILGAQLLSRYDITQSANTVSVAIANRNTIDDLAFVDMFFQPNYDQPFHYLNLVAQQAIEQEATADQASNNR